MAQTHKRETVVREQPVTETRREIVEDPNAPGRTQRRVTTYHSEQL